MWHPIVGVASNMRKTRNVVIGLAALLMASGARPDDDTTLCPATIGEAVPLVELQLTPSRTAPVSKVYAIGCAVGQLQATAQLLTSKPESGAPSFTAFKNVCFPKDTPANAIYQAFLNWAKTHPETWHYQVWLGAVSSLVATWPCEAR